MVDMAIRLQVTVTDQPAVIIYCDQKGPSLCLPQVLPGSGFAGLHASTCSGE